VDCTVESTVKGIKRKKKAKKKIKASAFSLWTAYNIKRWNQNKKTNEKKEKKIESAELTR
jgi:hypothetical protein